MTTPHETARLITQADDLFIAAMALNRRNFDAGHFDHAYHALVAALHLAQITGNHRGFLLIEQTAREQYDWINRHDPDYRHSGTSARGRGYEVLGVWEVLATMAQSHAEFPDVVYPAAAAAPASNGATS